MQSILVVDAGSLRRGAIGSIGFVDHDHVRQLHDSALHALQFVSGTSERDEQKKIDHVMHGGFGLADSNGFDQDILVTRGLA